jgi:hypothetical protein
VDRSRIVIGYTPMPIEEAVAKTVLTRSAEVVRKPTDLCGKCLVCKIWRNIEGQGEKFPR